MPSSAALQALIVRPVAHRGLHDAARDVIENTASAVAAAVVHGFGVEVDVQISSDGEAMVHHDDALGRLTEGSSPLAALTAAELARVPFRGTADRMMTLGDLLDLVAGRVALVIEIKSRFDGDIRLARRCIEVLASYRGPCGLMSFDPAVVGALRAGAPRLPRGIVAERRFKTPGAAGWTLAARVHTFTLAHLLHAPRTRPDFLAYRVDDLPVPATRLARALGRPVLTWTVRTNAQREHAARWADQIIFEGFLP
jgi:glycerophosphoryl diester phosphodiesterase